MAQRTIQPSFIQMTSRRPTRCLATPASILPALGLVGALSPAAILGLLALPAAAAGLDPAKVNADPTAQRTLEAIDAAHHLQPLGTLAHYVLTADAQGQTCTLADKGNDIFMMECTASKNGKIPSHSLLLTGENGRLLVVSMYGADNHLLPTGDAFQRLSSVAPVQPEIAATSDSLKATASFDSPSIHQSVNTDRCLWTSVHSMKVDMGSLYPLENFVKQVGGRCTMDETKGGEAEISCQFPDAKTHNRHALLLQGDNDGADCYGVTHIVLDGQILPYNKYVQIFVDHK